VTIDAARAADLLRSRGLVPKRAWGQNFLRDRRLAERIAAAATTPPGGTVLEIGAGLGALTVPLLERAARVVAVERDRELAAALGELLGGADGLRLVTADALKLDWRDELGSGPRPHAIAGNLPYAITGRLLERAVAVAPHIERAVFMVQREVADRVAASPGGRVYGALSVFVQAAFRVDKLYRAQPGAFWPQPQVASAVLRLRPWPTPRAVESATFRRVVKAAFGQRRKTLRNAWRQLCAWGPRELERIAASADIELDARAETLSVEAFARLAAELERCGHGFGEDEPAPRP